MFLSLAFYIPLCISSWWDRNQSGSDPEPISLHYVAWWWGWAGIEGGGSYISTTWVMLFTSHSVQFTQLCPTLCDPMNHSTPGLPVHHQLPEFTQTHVHWVGDAKQPCHPLSSPSPPALNLSQHQGLFKWVSFSHQVAKVLEFQLPHQSFQWSPRTDAL